MTVRRSTKSIILHHTLSPDVSIETVTEWHKERGFDGCGYHALIRTNGDIEYGRQLDLVGAHAKGRNLYSLGLAIAGNFNTSYPTLDQYEAAVWQFTEWNRMFGGGLELGFHRFKRDLCPGKNFDRQWFKWLLINKGNKL